MNITPAAAAITELEQALGRDDLAVFKAEKNLKRQNSYSRNGTQQKRAETRLVKARAAREATELTLASARGVAVENLREVVDAEREGRLAGLGL